MSTEQQPPPSGPIRIDTLGDVEAFVSHVMRTVGAMTDKNDRPALGHAMTAIVMFAVVSYAQAVNDPLQTTEARLTWDWVQSIWDRPVDAMTGARERLGRIGSTAAVHALSVTAPGTAWCEIAKVEVSRRARQIEDWVVVDGGIRVIPMPTSPPKQGEAP